jgi:TusA-related sulfurtransferase
MTDGEPAIGAINEMITSACIYDAGDTGCGDGLHMEFRRRIQSVEVGEIVEVILRDPSAKEDLPSLVRMMGHRIRATDELSDGRLQLIVERSR